MSVRMTLLCCVPALLLSGCESTWNQNRHQSGVDPRRGPSPTQRVPTWDYTPGTQPSPCPGGICPRPQPNWAEYANVPPGIVQPNWRANNGRGAGSCVWASFTTALRQQCLDTQAETLMGYKEGGATSTNLISAAEWLGIKYTFTKAGDERLLEWASDTNRSGVIFYKYRHACLFVGFKDGNAIIVDPNKPSVQEAIPKATFINNWKTLYNGFALFPVHTPGPPSPAFAQR